MKRRLAAVAAILLALGIGGVVVVRQSAPPGPTDPQSRAVSSKTPASQADAAPGAPDAGAPTANAAEVSAAGVRVLPGAQETVEGFNDPSHPPERDLAIIEEALARFRRVFGRNPPGGENAEIVAGLLGGNSKKLAVIPPDFPAVNAAGELVDRWSTPFHFHPVSATVIEVISAGPDRALWTADDIGALRPVDGPADR